MACRRLRVPAALSSSRSFPEAPILFRFKLLRKPPRAAVVLASLWTVALIFLVARAFFPG
jgi:hypothetical protein